MNRSPKILAPVSSLESAVGVVGAGADELYCAVAIPGAEHVLNRPAGCCLDTYEELGQIARYARAHGVETIVTLELPFMAEFMAEQMQAHTQACVDQGIDALIVGDLGLIMMVQEMALGIPIYASTYLVAVNSEATDFIHRQLGIRRIVLERHMTVGEIREVVERNPEVEIEVFVHGSGCSNINANCYLEGGRRRLTALEQEYRGIRGLPTPCRTPFDVYEFGPGERKIARAPVLDAYDFCALCQLPDLLEAGVAGLKIVGRCMPPAYQIETTRMYRQAVEIVLQQQEGSSRRAQKRRALRMIESFMDEPYQPIAQPRGPGSPSVPPTIRDILCGQRRCYFTPLFHVPYRTARDARRTAKG
jgi:putative protease